MKNKQLNYLLSSKTGPCCLSLTMVAWTTFLKADSLQELTSKVLNLSIPPILSLELPTNILFIASYYRKQSADIKWLKPVLLDLRCRWPGQTKLILIFILLLKTMKYLMKEKDFFLWKLTPLEFKGFNATEYKDIYLENPAGYQS